MTTRWTDANVPDLTGKTVVVTGANSGLGLETTKVLAAHGAQVVMACRDARKADAAVDEVRQTVPSAKLVVRALDLASLADIARFAKELLVAHPVVDVLINNAGIMAIPRRLTADGFEMQLGTNHLGHFALTLQVLPALEAAAAGRVVSVASQAHRMGTMKFDDLMGEKKYSAWGAYGQSKLANLLFIFELERRLRATKKKTIALAAHPGYAATNLQGVGPKMTNSSFGSWVMNVGNSVIAQSAAMGALPSLRAATDAAAKGGEYYGPDGFMQNSGYPVKVEGNAKSQSLPDAAKLWAISEQLTHVAM